MALPSSLALVQITGPIVDDQGTPLSGTLELRSSVDRVINVDGLVVPVYRRVAVVNGTFSYGLVPSSAFKTGSSPWVWHARFVTNDQTTSVLFDIKVPDTGPRTIGSVIVAADTSAPVVVGSTTTTTTANNGTGGTTQGTFYAPTVADSGALLLTFSSNWGITASGSGYYTDKGAPADQAAYLHVGTSGELKLVRPGAMTFAGSATSRTYNGDGTLASLSDGDTVQTYTYVNGRVSDVTWTYSS